MRKGGKAVRGPINLLPAWGRRTIVLFACTRVSISKTRCHWLASARRRYPCHLAWQVDKFAEPEDVTHSIERPLPKPRNSEAISSLWRWIAIVRAPLSRAASGLGLCESPVFETLDDPDYRTILGKITKASQQHQQEKRFDMEGFRPNDHYTIQMQRFGILPPDLAPDEPIDVYATDEAYWRTFWYRAAED